MFGQKVNAYVILEQLLNYKIPPFHCLSEANAWASVHALSMVTLYHQNIVDLLTEYINFAFYSIKIGLETPEIAKRGNRHRGGVGKHCEGGVHTIASLNLLIEKTDFAFYSIKIRLETPEMIPTLGTW